jgi:hypothetical protein
MADYFEENLQEASLGYVPFPLSDRKWGFGRRFARFEYPYRDGQGGEDLGRKIYTFTLTLPLHRGVEWPEPLYPDVYQKLIAIVSDPDLRGEVEYVDPEFGPLQVKILDVRANTPATVRNGVVLELDIEELGFDTDLLANLSKPKFGSASEAEQLAMAIDTEVEFDPAAPSDKPGFSLSDAWRSLQAGLDVGATAADVVAAQIDEIYLLAEKFLNFSAKDELQRWSIYISVVNFLGAVEDYADAKSQDDTQNVELVTVTLPSTMSAYDIASTYYGDAGRAESVVQDNPTTNPMAYPAGATVRLSSDAKSPAERQSATEAA